MYVFTTFRFSRPPGAQYDGFLMCGIRVVHESIQGDSRTDPFLESSSSSSTIQKRVRFTPKPNEFLSRNRGHLRATPFHEFNVILTRAFIRVGLSVVFLFTSIGIQRRLATCVSSESVNPLKILSNISIIDCSAKTFAVKKVIY